MDDYTGGMRAPDWPRHRVIAEALRLCRAGVFATGRRMMPAGDGGIGMLGSVHESCVRHLVDSNADAIVVIDQMGAIRFVNSAAEALFDSPAHELVGETFGLPLVPDGEVAEVSVVGEPAVVAEMRVAATTWEGEEAYLATLRDVTARKRDEEELRLAASVFEHATEAILITDRHFRIVACNRAFTTISGYPREEVLGHDPRFLRSERRQPRLYSEVRAALLGRGRWEGEVWNRRKDGRAFLARSTLVAVKDGGGRASHYIFMCSDITTRKRAEERLHYMAHYDELTGLPNRTLFYEQLGRALARAEREAQSVGLLFFDLDGFKNINDTLGHDAGDQLLRQVADRMRGLLRRADMVARLGGDEFTVVMEDRATPDQAAAVARKVIDGLSEPFDLDGQEMYITASVGIALFPENGREIEELVKNADAAMYQAKACGRSRYQFFTPEMNRRNRERLQLENRLRQAVKRDELQLYYQPQLDLDSGEIVRMEALLRWNDPELGMVRPGRFLTLAEETGLILPIGEWVLRTACHQVRAWRAAGLPRMRLAVNLSLRQLHQQGLIGRLRTIFAETGFDPRDLDLEITESFLMESGDEMVRMLRELKALGIQVAIDDFGTGYSSLTRLRRLPVDGVKIDQSFIGEIASGVDGQTIVDALIGLAHSLGLELAAEGVETAQQRDFLHERRCHRMQGYYFSRPLPADGIPGLFPRRTSRQA